MLAKNRDWQLEAWVRPDIAINQVMKHVLHAWLGASGYHLWIKSVPHPFRVSSIFSLWFMSAEYYIHRRLVYALEVSLIELSSSLFIFYAVDGFWLMHAQIFWVGFMTMYISQQAMNYRWTLRNNQSRNRRQNQVYFADLEEELISSITRSNKANFSKRRKHKIEASAYRRRVVKYPKDI